MDDAMAAQLNHVGRFSTTQMGRFLNVTALELTIAARETYVPGSTEVEDAAKLRSLNECQHFLMGVLGRVLFSEELDTVSLIESLNSLSADKRVGESVQAALRRAMRQVAGATGFQEQLN